MASFVNYGETPKAENYLNRSRGTDAARASNLYGTLFEGIGTVVDSTVKMVDNQNITNINKELTAGIDAIRGAQGVDAAVNDPTVTGGETGSNVPGATAPPGVAAATSEIARINAAYKEGKIGDTYYYAKVESLARQVRNKYPGYRDIIDQKVSSIIGTNPANALRSSLLQDLKQAQSTAQSRANSDESIVERGKEYLSAEKYRRFVNGERDPAFVADLKMDIQGGEAKKQNIASLKSQYELRKAEGAAKKEDLERIVTRDSSDAVWKILNDGIESVGGGRLTLDGLSQRIAEMATGKPLDPTQLGELRAGINALTNSANMALDRLHSSPWGQNGQFTYQQEINDPQALTRIKEQALAPIRNMEKALTDGNIGLFTWHANQAKLMKDQAIQDIFARSDTVRKLAAAQEVLGPSFGQLLLESGVFAKALSDVSKAITMTSTAESASGTSNGQNILRDGIRELRDKGGNVTREAVQSVLTTTRNTLANKKIDEKSLANFAATWFNPERNFITDRDILTENSRMSVIQMFSAPEVVENLTRLKSSNPQVWNNYKSWLESSTRSVFNTTIGQIAEWQKPNSGYNVVVDNQGRVSVTAERTSAPGSFAGAASARDAAVRGVERQVAQLNSAIDARRRIAQSEGENPAQVGLSFLGALGVNPTVTPAPANATDGGEAQGAASGDVFNQQTVERLRALVPAGFTIEAGPLAEAVGEIVAAPADFTKWLTSGEGKPPSNQPGVLDVLVKAASDFNAPAEFIQWLTNPSAEAATVNSESGSTDDSELLVELERGLGPVDLEGRDRRRSRAFQGSDPNWKSSGATIPDAADLKTGIRAAAKELGIDPVDLATVISYETGGTFSPSIRGGAGNRHIGLIQFGIPEQKTYGASQDQSVGEQMKAVVRYLKHRGLKPGMSILDLYSTINAGSPGRYGASDANNGGAPGTVRDKVNNQMSGHRRKAMRLLQD